MTGLTFLERDLSVHLNFALIFVYNEGTSRLVQVLVFSQFTSMLQLMLHRLEATGLKCVMLEGSMTLEQRDTIITQFTTDPAVNVFLMSLKAGGVALNLTAATHVMLMDPWWYAQL